jgi:hypothetical protein
LDLPNELIIRILTDEDVFFDLNTWHLTVMASVCTELRDVIHSHVPFWTEVSNYHHLGEVELYLARSKQAPLKIDIRYPLVFRHLNAAAFLKKAMEEHHRWESLVVHCDGRSHEDREETSKVQALLREIHSLPKLKTLTFNSPNMEQQATRPYIGWHAPLLEELTIWNDIPSVDVSFRLTSCLFVLDEEFRHNRDPLSKLLDFLASQPSLVNLHLNVAYFNSITAYPVGVPVEMPELKSVHIATIVCDSPETLRSITSMMQSIKAAKLGSIHLELSIDEDQKLEALFPQFNDYSELRELYISNTYGERTQRSIPTVTSSPFQFIFTRFHNLTHLYVITGHRTINLLDAVPSRTIAPPPLKHLKISTNASFSSDSMLNVMEYLRCGGRWDQFQRLEVRGCTRLLDSDGWLKSFPNGKVLVDSDFEPEMGTVYFEVQFDHEERARWG